MSRHLEVNKQGIHAKGLSPNRIEEYKTPHMPPGTRKIIQGNMGADTARTKKEGEKQSTLIQDDQILNINCMNCQGLISIDQIEEHSKQCTTISEDVQTLEAGNYLAQVIFKLNKLDACLMELSRNPELRPGDKNYVNIFKRLCQKTVSGNAEDTDSVITSLSSLLVTFKGSLSIRVYADRLQALVQEQKIGFQELEIENKKQELEKIKEEVEKYKTRSQVLQKTLIKTTSSSKVIEINRKIDEIYSDLGSLHSGTSEATALSALDEEKKQDFEESPACTTDLQKHFYSLCLSIKMRQAEKMRIQNVSLQKLYKEAIEKKVPPDVWAEFISNQLKNPSRYLEDGKGRRRVQPKSSAMKPQYFEVIVEEEER